MAFLRSSWRFVAVLAAFCALSLGIGCGGGGNSGSDDSAANVTVSGTVTYTRVPLVSNSDGTPLGLETDSAKFKSLPLRGVIVRAFKGKTETDFNGNSVVVWMVVGSTTTGSDGKYSISVPKDESIFLEVLSSAIPYSGASLRLLADDIDSSIPVADRSYYALRKGADGLSPAGEQTPGSTISADATLDFAIDLNQAWWIAPISYTSTILKTTSTIGASTVTTWSPNATLETTGTGSRVAGILDSAYTFGSTHGDPTPKAPLYLHYRAASSELRPSFIEYDREVYPKSYDGSSLNYFGFLRGAGANDDAWDEGILYQLFARNMMVGKGFLGTLPTDPLIDRSDLQDLRPDMALLEGFSQAMAAILQKSPYLVDTSAGAPTYRDIRDTTGLGADAYSAANVAAIAWKFNLHASGTITSGVVTPIADTPTGWSGMSQVALLRLFNVTLPKDSSTGFPTDIASIYSQVARLKETLASGEPVDLAAYFPDATLTTLLAPFNITWPRPTTTATIPDPLVPDAGFLANWGANPNSTVTAIPTFTLSMANAHKNRLNLYPNFSKGEVFNARFTLSGDKIYLLRIQTPSGIPAGAEVEVIIGGKPYSFMTGTDPIRLPALSGNATTPINQQVQVRLRSPSTLQSDLPITLRLEAQN
jgi:hypothetical protein